MRPGLFERKVGCNCDPKLWKRLQAHVQRTGDTRGQILRLALAEYLDRAEWAEKRKDAAA